MAFVRDTTSYTRGVGAIAALDAVSSRNRSRARAQMRALQQRDRILAAVARSQPLTGRRLAMGAVAVNPLANQAGRRPMLNEGGVIEGEGKSNPIRVASGTTIKPLPVPPGGSGSGGGGGPTLMSSAIRNLVLDPMSTKKPPRPGRPSHPTRPSQPPPTPTPSPVVLLPVPNVDISAGGGSSGGGGPGGGGGGGSLAPLPEDDLTPPEPITPAPKMSTGAKVGIGLGLLGLAYLVWENSR